MKLTRIAIARAAGISEPFTLDGLSREINVIVGPNGSGKTTLCRALAATLWPRPDHPTALEVDTDWDEDGQLLQAQRRGGRVLWQRDGAETGPPSLPDAHLEACYTLGVRDLMQEGHAADIDIARQIRVQMAGGYDIQSAIERNFSVKRNFGVKETREISDLRGDAAAVRRRFDELAADEDRLVELEDRQQQAQRAEREQRVLDAANELAVLRKTVDGLDANLTAYSSALDAFTGDEAERIDRLEKELGDCAAEIADNRAEEERAQAKISDARLDAQPPEATDLAAWSRRIDELREQQRELRSARRNQAQRQAELAAATANLGGDPPTGVALDLSDNAMEEVAGFVKQGGELTGRGSSLQAQLQLREPGAVTESRENLLRGTGFLRDWLSAPQAADLKAPPWLLVVALTGVLLGMVLAWLQSPLWLALSGLGAGLAFILLFPSMLKQGRANERPLYASKFEQCGLELPDDWSREAVLRLLQDLEQRIARANLAAEQDARLALVKVEFEQFKRDEAEHEKQRVKLHEMLGIDIQSDLTLADLMYRYQAYREASQALAQASALVTSLSETSLAIIEAALSFLSPFGYAAEDDAAGLEAQFQDLKERLGNYQAAIELRGSAGKRLEKEELRRLDIQRRSEEFYTARGLASGDRDALTRMLEQLPDYTELKRDRDQRVRHTRQLEHKLADRPDLLELTEEQALQLGEEARQKARGLADIAAEIGGIKARVTEARQGNALELAEARLEQARGDLLLLCEQAQRQAAGRFLLEEVDREHERLSRPPVMERAVGYFSAFTRNAYELQLADGDKPEFSARDNARAISLTLAQLSDGTRIQLLLAVRIAFALEAERGTKVPLLLDEALSTADPERFRAVAESLALLAREGRQIFYLTANPADVAAWNLVQRGSHGPEPHIIDLGRVRGAQAAVSDIEMLRITPPPEVPGPGAMTAEQYAMAIGVPPAGALQPVASLHLFYLLRDDLESLYTLLHETRITTLGHWLSLSESGRAGLFLAAGVCARLDALCRCAADVYAGRSIGRGRPVDGEVLRASGAVSATFLEHLTSLADDLGGDSQRFLAAFEDRSEERVKRFRKEAQRQLHTYLEDQGYLDSRPQLSANEIRLQVIVQTRSAIDAGIVTREECGRFVDQLLSALDKTDRNYATDIKFTK